MQFHPAIATLNLSQRTCWRKSRPYRTGSKIQSYLSIGKPIVAAVPGEGNVLLKKAGVRLICKPDNPNLLAELTGQFVKMNPTKRSGYGKRGKEYYWNHLCFNKGFAQFQKIYRLVAIKSHLRY